MVCSHPRVCRCDLSAVDANRFAVASDFAVWCPAVATLPNLASNWVGCPQTPLHVVLTIPE